MPQNVIYIYRVASNLLSMANFTAVLQQADGDMYLQEISSYAMQYVFS